MVKTLPGWAPGVDEEPVSSFLILGNAVIASITFVAFVIAGISYLLLKLLVNPLFIKLLSQRRP
jgi:hypothetical protein